MTTADEMDARAVQRYVLSGVDWQTLPVVPRPADQAQECRVEKVHQTPDSGAWSTLRCTLPAGHSPARVHHDADAAELGGPDSWKSAG